MTGERFREEVQFFHWVVNLLFLLVAILFIWAFIQQVIFGIPFGAKPAGNIFLILFGLFFCIGIPLLLGRMVTVVNEEGLRVSFGCLGWIKKKIPLSDIKEAEVVTYRPIRQFGGWGIRCGCFRGERTGCYSAKGDKGVLISLSGDVRVCLFKTRKLIIGSQTPEKLVSAIKR